MRVFLKLLLLCSVLSAVSCTPDRQRLNAALEAAGDNRAELEKVLRHYEGDTLKYRAARFLIENMPHCYAYRQGGTMDSVKRVRTYTNSFGQLEAEHIRKWGWFDYRRLPKVYDVEVITADYLIRNIDHAFAVWRKRPWNRSLSFEDFCEYLLPYRIGDEPLEEWRELYASDFSHLLDSVYTGSDVVEAVNVISRYLLHPVFIYCEDFSLPHIGPGYLFRHRYGTCMDAADIMVYAFRSVGIPCVEDTDARGSHIWIAVRDTTGRDEHLWYINGEMVRGSSDRGGHKRGKVFRHTYGLQQDRLKLYREGRTPPLFSHPYVKDVSAEYYPDTLRAPLPASDDGFCYLSYYRDRRWWACVAVRPAKGMAVVPNLESELVYLPQHYTDGTFVPAGYPLWFAGGKVRTLQPDTSCRKRVRLYRKFPYYSWIKRYLQNMTGSLIEGSLTPDFRNPRLLHAVSDTPTVASNLIGLPSPVLCRYVRLKAPSGKRIELAELAVYSEGQEVKPVSIGGSEGEKGNRNVSPRHLTDSDPLTYFISQETGGEVVLDLGRAVPVDRIGFMPRNDDNFVRPGDSYELLYHAGKEDWKNLLRVTADTTYLEAEVPANALFWLRDLTRGREEHVFFMEGDRQKFPVF